MTEELAQRFVNQESLFDLDQLFHGFVVMVNDKIWRNNMGVFIFDSQREANQAFYNCERWKFTRTYSAYQHGTNEHGCPIEYDRNTQPWRDFKRLINYRIVQI